MDLDWANESLDAASVVESFRGRYRVCIAVGNGDSNQRVMLPIPHAHSSSRRVA